MQKKYFISFWQIAIISLLLAGCSNREEDARLHILQYESEILGKEMISQV